MQLRTQALKGIKWTSIASFITTILSIVQIAFLGRMLPPSDFGLMAIIMVVIGLAQAFSDMGISNAIIHYQTENREQLSTLYWVNMLTGFALFLVLLFIRPLIVALYQEPRLDPLLLLISFVFLIVPFGQQSQVLLQRELEFGILALADIAAASTAFAVAVSSAYAGLGATSLVLGHLANAFVSTLILAGSGWRRWMPRLHFRRNDLKGYLAFGFYQMGERAINFLGGNLDKLLIGSLLGAQQLGIYSVAYQLMAKPFMAFNPVIMRVAFPLFARIQHDNERLRSGFLDAIRVIAFILFPIYAGMMALARPLILTLLGDAWLPAVPVFMVLCLLGFFFSLGNPLGSLLLAKGRADVGFSLNVLMIVLYGTVIWAGSAYGLIGIATGLVCSTALILFPLGFWIRWKLVHLPPGDYLRAFLPMFVACAVMAVILLFLNGIFSRAHSTLVQTSAIALIGFLAYMAIMFFWQRQTFMRIMKGSW